MNDATLDDQGFSILHRIVLRLHGMDLHCYLDDIGTGLDGCDANGRTPLLWAAWRGDEDCVELLCNEGADVTYRSPGRGLAIVAAASALHPSCATVLADKMGLNIETYREQG